MTERRFLAIMRSMSVIDLRFTTLNQHLPDFIYQKLADYSAKSNSYHHQPDELRSLIAQKHGLGIDSVALSAGTDQAILLLSTLYGQHGHIFTPTYISYTDIKRVGGDLTEHYSLDAGVYSVSASTIDGASLIFIANPNNPAGITDRHTILELVKNNPRAKVVVDEAYGDLAGESVIQDVSNHTNLIVLRSFSKGYALAGFRIGYIIAQPKVLEDMVLESTWFNVAYTSVGAAVAALEHEDYFAEIRASVVTGRQQFEAYLVGAGYNIVPSSINAVLLKFDSEEAATSFVDSLKAKEIQVNQGNGASNTGLDESFVRMSIGTSDQMAAVGACLSGILQNVLKK
jgi:histidinol-phosphate aminotransferase